MLGGKSLAPTGRIILLAILPSCRSLFTENFRSSEVRTKASKYLLNMGLRRRAVLIRHSSIAYRHSPRRRWRGACALCLLVFFVASFAVHASVEPNCLTLPHGRSHMPSSHPSPVQRLRNRARLESGNAKEPHIETPSNVDVEVTRVPYILSRRKINNGGDGDVSAKTPRPQLDAMHSHEASTGTQLGFSDDHLRALQLYTHLINGREHSREAAPRSHAPRRRTHERDYPKHKLPSRSRLDFPLTAWAFRPRRLPRGKRITANASFHREKSIANCCSPFEASDQIWVVCDNDVWSATGGPSSLFVKGGICMKLKDVARRFTSNFECVFHLMSLDCGDDFERAVCCSATRQGTRTTSGYCQKDDLEIPCWEEGDNDDDTESDSVDRLPLMGQRNANRHFNRMPNLTSPVLQPQRANSEEEGESLKTSPSTAWHIGRKSRILSGSIAVGGGLVGSVIYTLTSHTFVNSSNAFVQAATKQPSRSGVTRVSRGVSSLSLESNDVTPVIVNLESVSKRDIRGSRVFERNGSAEFWSGLTAGDSIWSQNMLVTVGLYDKCLYYC